MINASGEEVDGDVRKALSEVRSGSLKGLNELKEIFSRKSRSAERLNLSDDLIHTIFEVLFEDVAKTKSVYSKSKTARTEATAESRLAACAAVLRHAVDTWVERIRSQTVRALIDHVTQLLPTPASGFCKPLRLDYLRTLVKVFEYQPHVEHLQNKRWDNVAEFCLAGIQAFGEDLGYFAETSNDGTKNVGPENPATPSSSNQRRRIGLFADSSACLEELLRCLSLLTLASNAPVTGKAQDLLDSVGALLETTRSNMSSSSFHVPAMMVLNNVLSRVLMQSTKLTFAAVKKVLPTFGSMWSTRDILLRDEVLISLFYIQEYLLDLVGTEQGRSVTVHVERLLESMSVDYYDSLRGVRGHLELDDLDFSGDDLGYDLMPFQTHCFTLRKATVKSEHNWALLYFLAFLTNWVDLHNEIEGGRKASEGSPDFHKRRRKERKFDVLLDTVGSSSVAERPFVLQVLSFVVARRSLSVNEIRAVANHVMIWVTDANATVSSWAMLGLLGCAMQESAATTELADLWSTTWKTTLTMITSAPHASAACQLLKTLMERERVMYADMAESLELIASAPSIHGPSVLSDSTLGFWDVALTLRTKYRPSSARDRTAEEVLRWIFLKWNPSAYENRQHSRQIARTISPRKLAKMFYSACDIDPFQDRSVVFPRLENIGHAALHSHRSRKLVRYLLLSDERKDVAVSFAAIRHSSREQPHWIKQCKNERLTLDLFIGESSRVHDSWLETTRTNAHLVTEDVVHVVFSFCLVAASAAAALSTTKSDQKRLEGLQKQILDLTKLVLRVVRQPDDQTGGLGVMHAAFEVIAIFLLPVRSEGEFQTHTYHLHLTPVIGIFIEAMEVRREGFEVSQKQASLEFDDFVTEMTDTPQNSFLDTQTQFPRADIPAQSSASSFICSTTANLYFLDAVSSDYHEHSNVQVVPSRFVDYLLKLPVAELIACRSFLKLLLNGELRVLPSDAERFLVHLAKVFLAQSYEYERCEVSMGLCLDIMIGLASLWTDHELESLSEAAEDIYRWFIMQALARGIASVGTQSQIIDLLYCMLRIAPDFGVSTAMPSIRTTLFSVLKEGEVSVQYHVAQRIPEVFRLFVLAQHNNVFDDVHRSLPNVEECIEGIFVRLLVLSRLGAAWQTLLRRSLYHIIETAGLLDAAVPHALMCIRQLSRTFALEDPRELFRLFSPQLLYSWTMQHKLQDFPFRVFGYATLKELLTDVQGEVVSQVIMNGSETDLDLLEGGKSLMDLVELDFSQVTAYCFAADVCSPNVEGSPSRSSETRLRNILSRNRLASLLAKNLARVIGFLFLRLEGEHLIDKVLSKRPGYEQAVEIFRNIKAAGFSDVLLPPTQQPCFTARKLLEEIERLCRRCGKEALVIWTPETVFTVARMLVSDMHPVFGPLHSRRIVLRIRLLLSLAGSAALTGYPLEMIIHALRHLATDQNCAEDAQGCLRYLFDKGKSYLISVPTFTGGTSLALFLTLREFLKSAQDQTIQESQHRATMSQSQTFHHWLESYVNSYNPDCLSKSSAQLFHNLLRSASLIVRAEESGLATAENHLLSCLLDTRGRKDVLRGPLNTFCFNLFSHQFQGQLESSEDAFEPDEAAAHFAPRVWKSSAQFLRVGEKYLLWAVRLLGRSFAYRGQLPAEIAAESDYLRIMSIIGQPTAFPFPKVAVLKLLIDHLQHDSPSVVAAIENGLHHVVSIYKETQGRAMIEETLPHALLVILDKAAEPYRDIKNSSLPRLLSIADCFEEHMPIPFDQWIRMLTIAMCTAFDNEPILAVLPQVLHVCEDLAEDLFPYVVHMALLQDKVDGSKTRELLSKCIQSSLHGTNETVIAQNGAIINSILYLRAQALPQEHTLADRNTWLDINYLTAAQAAVRCKMFKSALLFNEIHREQTLTPSSGSHSSVGYSTPDNMLLDIYRQIEDPDSYYGVKTPSTLNAIVDRLGFEGNGVEGLLLHGAQSDGFLRSRVADEPQVLPSIIRSIASLNLSSLTHNLIVHNQDLEIADSGTDELLQAAMRLRKWDIPVESNSPSHTAALYRAFQSLDQTSGAAAIAITIGTSMKSVFQSLRVNRLSGQLLRNSFATLATLTEIDDVVRSGNADQVAQAWERMKRREMWMENARLVDISQILSSREVLLGILNDRSSLREISGLDVKTARFMEVDCNLRSSFIYRKHDALQASLSNVTYLTSLIPACEKVGLNFECAVGHETASVLWGKGELQPSIQTSLNLVKNIDFGIQSIRVGKADILAVLGSRISEARLERPDEILNKYLMPSLKELKGNRQGSEAGRVFHEYATYCYNQLQNPDVLKEIQRSERFRRRKYEEIRNLDQIIKTAGSEHDKRRAKNEATRAKIWLQIDEDEYHRLKRARAESVRQSLDNFLLSLAASDAYETDVLKFVATWLQNAEDAAANDSVSRLIKAVSTFKFAKLMNQLASRLQDSDDRFQSILRNLVERICIDHPYHGMPNIFAGSKTSGGNDKTAASRNAAAVKVAHKLQQNLSTSKIWGALHRSNELYIEFASLKSKDMVQNTRWALAKFQVSKLLLREIPALQVPPITLTIDIRADLDYGNVPTISSFGSNMTIAGGISAPKIVVVVTSTGKSYKQLYKSGSDDLRQDAIMEQVFSQVTELLKTSKATRQRKLQVRTYNVVPLNASTGAIEFCQPSIPLNEYLTSAHEQYYPRDLKWGKCRNAVAEVVEHAQEVRIKVYQNVTSRFHPVLRHFFFERFLDPDDWFERRLAYTRSTAAISILGHVLGLGDRHCQNILLDTNTGEVIHIDLGVAFEAGRVLNVPETVPFRLTRDIVDGFGIAGTEGVFRRCCEFTLEALRTHKNAIMTLLNVLRYDPLYSWSLSPLRAKRMQEEQDRDIASTGTSSVVPSTVGRPSRGTRSSAAAEGDFGAEPIKKDEDEADEAVRALGGVEKKLTTNLSVTAAVNELIQQATDEKNLALLFAGWAAYA